MLVRQFKWDELEEYRQTIIGATTVDPAWGSHDNHFYHGDKDLIEWGTIMVRGRDDGVRNISNFEFISEDLKARFPGDVDVEEWDHDVVGWIRKLMIRVDNPELVEAAFEWQRQMQDYPVADDEHFSEMEEEEVERCYNSYGKDEVIRWLKANDNPYELLDEDGEPKESEDHYLYRLFGHCHSYNGEYYVDDHAMQSAIGEVGYEITHDRRREFERTQPPLPQE